MGLNLPKKRKEGTVSKKTLQNGLFSLLTPKNKIVYNEFINSLPDNIKLLWYPSAGEDFRDLLFTHEKYEHKMEQMPDLYIHSDYYPWEQSKFLDNRIVYKDGKTEINVVEISELTFNKKDISFELDKRVVDFPEGSKASGKVCLLKLTFKSDVLGVFEKYVLYFFFENTNFLKEIIFKNNLKISHLVTIRDGAGLGGGGRVNMKFLEFYLGLFETQYLLTDNFGRERAGFELIRDDNELVENYNLPENKPVILIGIKDLHWSGYGNFLNTDAIIIKVERY